MKILLICVLTLFACNPANNQGSSSSSSSATGTISKDAVKKLLMDNPDILTDVIEAHPAKILDTFQAAAKKAQQIQKEKQRLESFNKPLVAKMRSDELYRGNKDAPLQLVEYSDFQCFYCSKAYQTVMSLLEKYKGKISFVYKHLPVIGKYSKKCSEFYEAIRLQSGEKAMAFHDELYKNQKAINSGGEKFLKEMAVKVGADVAKIEADIKAGKVAERIKQDTEEARKFGFSGTPGFLLNGIAVKGAYPLDHFEGIVEELKKRGKVKL